MSETFGDTFFYLALLNSKDAGHPLALAASDKLVGKVVTTQWVLTEVGDALCHPADRPKFLGLLAEIETNPDIIVVPATNELFLGGVQLYRARPDKRWSLTDCISFVVMQERGITEALTGDEHFRQAGFVPLLQQP